jgi:hypothetical protein
MFPAETDLFGLMIDRYARLPSHTLRTVYVEQMVHLAASRIADTTASFVRFTYEILAISDATDKVKIGFKHH